MHRSVVGLGLAFLLAACGDSTATGGNGGSGAGVASGGGGAANAGGSGTGGAGGGGQAGPIVQTDKGPVEGAVIGQSRVFLGIPFAAPPLGDLRWKPPQAHDSWTDPLDATKVGPKCAQLGAIQPTFDATSSEDCLTVNVWAPKVAPETPVPVLVWIYGGTFVVGTGGDPEYDGRLLAEATGSVVVTFNYRLGPMGFLALPGLEAEDAGHPSSGMYGIEDQRAALAWTQDNIEAFGGDPTKVTMFGESAGATSTCIHLLSPDSAPLYQGAMLESGTCAIGRTPTTDDANAHGAALASALGCAGPDPDLACLRGKSAEEVLLALPTTAVDLGSANGWSPHIDGLNLPDEPLALLAAGDFASVPVLLGSNDDEGTLFFAFGSPVTDEASYQVFAETAYPGHGSEIVAEYPSATYGSPQAAATEALADAIFVCSARRMARALESGGVPTWLYHFEHAPAAVLPNLGAYHSSEIPFVFGNPGSLSPNSPSADEAPLVASMQGYWGRMAASGDPNGDGAPAWPAYTTADDSNVVLDLDVSTESGRKSAECDFWDGI